MCCVRKVASSGVIARLWRSLVDLPVFIYAAAGVIDGLEELELVQALVPVPSSGFSELDTLLGLISHPRAPLQDPGSGGVVIMGFTGQQLPFFTPTPGITGVRDGPRGTPSGCYIPPSFEIAEGQRTADKQSAPVKRYYRIPRNKSVIDS
ncbi:hypothetical protein NDU88_001997 [Pleurodeles waltl]|uniref:Uncharacterized protein n=1 Tax=Pleurodeles waltl TaxID=8319 RepID=A0AAV7QAE5_PLEWA|nr:hypothetical protein NDU88_001997 [Pleurodeles waltl]